MLYVDNMTKFSILTQINTYMCLLINQRTNRY